MEGEVDESTLHLNKCCEEILDLNTQFYEECYQIYELFFNQNFLTKPFNNLDHDV